MSANRLLTVNAGSSTLKVAVYEAARDPRLILSGQVSDLSGAPVFRAKARGGEVVHEDWTRAARPDDAMDRLFGWLETAGWTEGLVAIGHRIVHGGLTYTAPVRLDPAVLHELETLAPMAPLHQPFNLRGVALAAERFAGAIEVGVFDTAFHARQPRVARLYALPRALIAEGVLAYGFHGLSYDYIAGVLRVERPDAGGRAIVLHLGSGASLCAMTGGRSLATTMGFSALDGPPMSTRCGALDPGVVLHLVGAKGMSVEAATDLLYHRSGLLGLSGVSGDMVTLLGSQEPQAREALDVYVYRLAREIGSLAAALGGLDTLVFTAGVGENAAEIRSRIAAQCGWLGVRLDDDANARGARQISHSASVVRVLVIPTDEQVMIARGVMQVLSALGSRG